MEPPQPIEPYFYGRAVSKLFGAKAWQYFTLTNPRYGVNPVAWAKCQRGPFTNTFSRFIFSFVAGLLSFLGEKDHLAKASSKCKRFIDRDYFDACAIVEFEWELQMASYTVVAREMRDGEINFYRLDEEEV